jgi:hypothetical protein
MSDQNESQLPGSREELLKRISQEWDGLMALVNRLPPPLLDKPGPGGWTPKDNLAHLYEWERFMLERYLRGQNSAAAFSLEEGALKDLDEDGINELLYQRNRSRFPGDVIELLRLTHETMLDELKKTPWEQLLQPMTPGRPSRLEYVLGNTADHYVEHRRNIEAVISL